MANNVIGYIGIENFEMMLYLARILNKLKQKVLLIDLTADQDLASCIPVPIGLDPSDDVISYYGVDFTKAAPSSDMLNEYDVVLISFGFNISAEIKYCNRIVYAVNQMLHNINRVAALAPISAYEKHLIIKDMVSSKITPEYIADCLKLEIKPENIITLDFDEVDMKYKILAQHDSLFTFSRITNKAKRYLITTVRELNPEVTEKELREAYRLAERGR